MAPKFLGYGPSTPGAPYRPNFETETAELFYVLRVWWVIILVTIVAATFLVVSLLIIIRICVIWDRHLPRHGYQGWPQREERLLSACTEKGRRICEAKAEKARATKAERRAAREVDAMQDFGIMGKGKGKAKARWTGPDSERASVATRVSEYFSTEEVAAGSSSAPAPVRRESRGIRPSGTRRVSIEKDAQEPRQFFGGGSWLKRARSLSKERTVGGAT